MKKQKKKNIVINANLIIVVWRIKRCVCAYSKTAHSLSSAEARKKCTNILMVFIKDFMRSTVFFFFFYFVYALHPFLFAFFFSSLESTYSVWFWMVILLCISLMMWFVIKTTPPYRILPWYWWAHKICHYLFVLHFFKSRCDAMEPQSVSWFLLVLKMIRIKPTDIRKQWTNTKCQCFHEKIFQDIEAISVSKHWSIWIKMEYDTHRHMIRHTKDIL